MSKTELGNKEQTDSDWRARVRGLTGNKGKGQTKEQE